MSTEKTEVEKTVTANAIDLLGGLVDPKTVQEIADIHIAKASPLEKEKPEKKAEKKVEKKPEAELEEEEEEIEEEEEEVVDDKKKPEGKEKKDKKEVDIPENKFGFKPKKEKEKQTLDIESFDELPKVLKAKYGQDIKDVKGLGKFFETADKWRSDSQSLEKVTKEKEDALAVFQNLPDDLLEDIKAHYRGEDWKEAREKTPKLDFSKPADKQDIKKLVNTYFPGDFKEDDFEAEEKSKELIIAEKASIKQYNADKTGREERAKQSVDKASNKEKAYKASVLSSVETLKKDFPDMTADVVADIHETLTSGTLMAKFYNKDGTLKADAAKRLAFSLHGEDFINQLMGAAFNQGESASAEDFVERAATKKKTANSKGQEGIRKEVTERINDLIPQGIVGKRTF